MSPTLDSSLPTLQLLGGKECSRGPGSGILKGTGTTWHPCH